MSKSAKIGDTGRARWVRFGRSESGAAAIEFAIVAIPFLFIVFAIIETAMIFFAGQVLQTGVSESARLIRTGQAQEQTFDEAKFKEAVCSNIPILLNCEDGVMLDVRTFDSFSEIDFDPLIDEDGNLIKNFVYQDSAGGDIVVVRAFYEWPALVPDFGGNLKMGNLAGNKRLLAAAATFRNEPFSW